MPGFQHQFQSYNSTIQTFHLLEHQVLTQLHFNPIIVRFKHAFAAGVASEAIEFQSYNSTIQTTDI